ncbi:MAG TPA: hypothetical protein VJ715_17355, partial [Pyrinomonadaceae bacterium]|nr:hypothetical protein [Pyrinomonadaceae bacterium]
MSLKKLTGSLAVMLLLASMATAQENIDTLIESELPALVTTYKSLHASPELSYAEEKTAAFLAQELRSLGFTVTERIGKYDQPGLVSYGLVAVLKNGDGPTVWVRSDLDGLPVTEETGLPYASHVKVKGSS